MNRIKTTLTAICLSVLCTLICSCSFPFSTVQGQPCDTHRDNNGDLLCDECGVALYIVCSDHRDGDHNGKCDTAGCTLAMEIIHTDNDHDGKCDISTCGASVEVIHRDANSNGKCDKCKLPMTNDEDGDTDAPHNCIDKNYDKKCDACQKEVISDGITLISNGILECSIVVADGVDSTSISTLQKLVNSLRGFGYYISVLDDDPKNLTDGVEILIGDVKSRGEKYATDPHYLGHGGYAVKSIDNKILVLGGSDTTLTYAINYIMKNGFGIKNSTKELDSATLLYSDECEVITSYAITSLSIEKHDLKGHVIACDTKSRECERLAVNIQTKIYKYAGYWLPIKDTSTIEDENYISIRLLEKSGGEGFYITARGANLEIISEFENKLYERADAYFESRLALAEGDVSFESVTENVRDINYEMFGAFGDGLEEHDDSDAMRK